MNAVSIRKVIPAVVVTLLLVAPWAAAGQDARPQPGADPVLEALVAEALARNPDVAAAQAAIKAAHARPGQVGALPDPMVSLILTNDGWAPSLGSMPMTTLGLMASQELPYPGKRQQRMEVAMSEARQGEPQLTRTRLAIEAAVTRAYYGLLLARELAELTKEQRELWRQVEVVTRARYAVGEGAQQDVLRVQVEVTRIEQRAIEQASEAELRLAELNRLLARPIEARIETSAKLALHPMTASLPDMIEQARTSSPDLAAARLAVATERSVLALAKLDFKPDFSVQASYMNRGGLSPMWLAGVGVSWPFNKAKRQSAVAESQLRSERDDRVIESIELQLRLRTQERYTRARTAEKIVDLYDQGIVPQDRMTVEAAIANYQSGRVPFVSVLEAMTSLYADRWTRETLITDHARLLASIKEASLEASPEMAAVGAVTAAQPSGVPGAMGGGMAGRQE
ncbi:MAG: TolC family protein [Acidobacteria bacterium]|nr:TolC family protein [Acidobacteriota bacterium]